MEKYTLPMKCKINVIVLLMLTSLVNNKQHFYNIYYPYIEQLYFLH